MKPKLPYIIIGLLILVVLFYWFEIRPARIRSQCGTDSILLFDKNNSLNLSAPDFYDFYYKKCLNQHGLK